MNIQDSYNKWSDIYDTNINLTRDLDSKVTRNLLAHRQFDAILELGCGTGKNTVFFAKIGKHVHAFDLSPGMIQKAKEKVKMDHVHFEAADLTKHWPCEDQAFDLVSCNLVLEHIEDLSHIFTEAARVLQSKGMLLVNELHPFRQYGGAKARFELAGQIVEVEAFVHHISDFIISAAEQDLQLTRVNEYWHEEDAGKPPRLVSFIFTSK